MFDEIGSDSQLQLCEFLGKQPPVDGSIGGAPSRVASRLASRVKPPILMITPLSARLTIAPRNVTGNLTAVNRLRLHTLGS